MVTNPASEGVPEDDEEYDEDEEDEEVGWTRQGKGCFLDVNRRVRVKRNSRIMFLVACVAVFHASSHPTKPATPP